MSTATGRCEVCHDEKPVRNVRVAPRGTTADLCADCRRAARAKTCTCGHDRYADHHPNHPAIGLLGCEVSGCPCRNFEAVLVGAVDGSN